MQKKGNWIQFIVLKIFQTFNIDLLAENKQLQDRVFELENENVELQKQISTQQLNHIPEKKLPPDFIRKHDNLLIAPDGTKYCWNCYNKQTGGEYRLLTGNEYFVHCRICEIRTELKKFVPPLQEPPQHGTYY